MTTPSREIALAVAHLDWAAGTAAKVLGRRRVGPGLLAVNQAAHLEYLPVRRGRRDRAVELPGAHAAGLDLLRAGRRQRGGVQAQRVHPGVGRWLVDSFAEVVPEQPVLQLVTGFGETGAALCRAGVDKLAFTGSAATGRKVMAACAADPDPGA